MKKLERILLAKVPVWLVVVMLTAAAAGMVVFGALVRDATTRALEYHDTEHFLGRVALGIAEIPETLSRLLSGSHPAEAQGQRFDGRIGLNFADTAHASGEGYLLLLRYLPKPRFMNPRKLMTHLELIDLSRRKTVHHWQLDWRRKDDPVYLLPDGSLITRLRTVDNRRDTIIRLDACSNVEWKERLAIHHSIERDADGNFWAPTKSRDQQPRKPGLAKFSPSGDVLTWIALDDVLARSGYRHLAYRMNPDGRIDELHVNDVQPVLRDGPFWQRGDLFVSLRNPSVVLLYRPATDEIVWLRQGPWMQQHDVDIVSDSEISVFNNNAVRTGDDPSRVLGANEVYVYDFATGEARSPWREAMRRHDVRTLTMGAATLFDDGGLMVEEHNYGRILRLSADGALLWSYVNRASDGRVYRLGWSRYLDADYGAEVMRSVAAAGCERSGPQAGTVH